MSKLWLGFVHFFKKSSPLGVRIQGMTGSKPINEYLYILALKHSSSVTSTHGESYERLEFLGDAIIGSIVAEYLFRKFPKEQEGFLTEMRSRMVNRERLSMLSTKIGLTDLIDYQVSGKNKSAHKSMPGDVLEALVGAIYLDRGYEQARFFIVEKLIIPHLDLSDLQETVSNFKSMMVEYAQKMGLRVEWKVVHHTGKSHDRTFVSQIFLNNEFMGEGKGLSKKKAEQSAAEQACHKLGLVEKN